MDRISAHLTKLRDTIATGVPDITEIDLPSVAESVARALAPLAIQEHVDLTVAAHGKVRARGDQEYVRIILENLIGNGLDVLRPRGKGTIEIEVTASGDEAFVRVRDDGPGIDPSLEGALFQPLLSTKERGLGLGLSVGRALARAMEGDLTVESHPSRGTVLCLALPVAS
jgi:signal transduction histidine kinase